MVGALPIDVSFTARPQGHGYVVGNVVGENPFVEVGQRLRGHEFHYAKVDNVDDLTLAYSLERGQGMGRKRDGIVHKNVLAGFTHLHALSEPTWAEGLVNPTQSRKTEREATAPAAHCRGDALQP